MNLQHCNRSKPLPWRRIDALGLMAATSIDSARPWGLGRARAEGVTLCRHSWAQFAAQRVPVRGVSGVARVQLQRTTRLNARRPPHAVWPPRPSFARGGFAVGPQRSGRSRTKFRLALNSLRSCTDVSPEAGRGSRHGISHAKSRDILRRADAALRHDATCHRMAHVMWPHVETIAA